MDLRELHVAMIRALDDELRVVPAPTELPAARRVALRDGYATYVFGMPAPTRARVGNEVGLWLDELALRATVIATSVDRLVLRVARDLGPDVPSGALLVLDDGWTLLAARRALVDVLEQRRPFNAEFALQILGLRALKRRLGELPASADDMLDHVSEEQGTAVRAFIGTRGVAPLWGPPGTGKTRTLAAGVAAHVEDSARPWQILVLAPTNEAVDVALTRVIELLAQRGVLAPGEVLRAGRGVTPEFRERHGAAHVLDDVAATRIEARVAVIDALRADRAQCEAELEALQADDSGREDVENGVQRRETACAMTERLRELETDIRRAERLASPAFVRQELIDNCRVLATTVAGLMLTRALTRRWDLVVMDESSMVSAIYSVLAASLATQGVWVLGDWLQLSPVVKATTAEARRWLKRSPFDAMGCYERGPDGEVIAAPDVSTLTEQFRFGADVAGMLNLAYGVLKTAPSVRRRPRPPFPFAGESLYLLDTSDLLATVERDREGSRVNEAHVGVARDLLTVLRARQALAVRGAGVPMGIITPFRGQARHLRAMVRSEFAAHDVAVGTVHTFQGQEVEGLLVLDLVDAPGLPLSRWLRARDWTDEGARLLLVGLSRPRSRVCVIGHVAEIIRQCEAIARTGRSGEMPIVYRILRHLENHAVGIEVQRDVVDAACASRVEHAPVRVAG